VGILDITDLTIKQTMHVMCLEILKPVQQSLDVLQLTVEKIKIKIKQKLVD